MMAALRTACTASTSSGLVGAPAIIIRGRRQTCLGPVLDNAVKHGGNVLLATTLAMIDVLILVLAARFVTMVISRASSESSQGLLTPPFRMTPFT